MHEILKIFSSLYFTGFFHWHGFDIVLVHYIEYNSRISYGFVFENGHIITQFIELLHSQKKGFFNGSSEWPKVLPGPFCYLNQAKGSPNYTQL